MNKILKNNSFIFLVIIILAAILRLYKINSPVLDLYPVRQEQCAMLARNFFRGELNILDGRIDWYGNLNPRWRLEFPLISYLAAICYSIFGLRESFGRVIAVLFSLGSVGVFYLLIKDIFNRKFALFSALIFAILPLNIYFSRVFMPEPLMMFFNLSLVWSFNRWLNSNRNLYYIFAVVFAILSFLTKIPTIFLLAVVGYSAFQKWGLSFIKKKSLWLFLVMIMIPVTYWYSTSNLSAIRLFTISPPALSVYKDYKFYDFMFRSFIILILTPIGIFPFIAGLLKGPENEKEKLFYVWLGILIIYSVSTSIRSSIHFYYQLPFVPVLSFFLAKGILIFLEPDYWKDTLLRKINPQITVVSVTSIIFLSSIFSIQPFYKYDISVYEAGKRIQSLTAPDSLIIAGRCFNQAPLYYCDRKGWEMNEEGGLSYAQVHYGGELAPFALEDELTILNYLIRKGAGYYLACNLGAFYSNQNLVNYLNNNYDIEFRSDKYLIYNLKHSKRKQ